MSDHETAIRWPDGYEPEGAPIYAVNKLEIDAPRERVWAWLERPDLWPSFYSNCWRVRHMDGPWPEVRLGSRFRWITFGTLVTSQIVEFDPPERLSWDARELGAKGLHGWVLEKRRGGCYVVTEETQRGWSVGLARLALQPLMVRYHQKWLEGLAKKATEGEPPAPTAAG